MGYLSIKAKQFLVFFSAALSIALLASGVVTWVASNWTSISPDFKILLVEGIIVVLAIILIWMAWSSPRLTQTVSLSRYWWSQGLSFFGAVVSGALVALVGQIYQMGADTWQLFALWLILIVPWFVFSPNVFIAALAAVVANTSAILFLLDNQLLFSLTVSSYVLALLNFVFFVFLEHKRARQDGLWAVLSMSALLCGVAIFVFTQEQVFQGVYALKLFVVALLLMFYNKLSHAPLRLKILVIAIFAAATTAFLIEFASDSWLIQPTFMLLMLGLVWAVAAVMAIALWNKSSDTQKDTKEGLLLKAIPSSINVFLAISLIVVAAFFYLSLFLTGSLDTFTVAPKNIVGSVALLLVVLFLRFKQSSTFVLFLVLIIYQMAAFLAIENYLDNNGYFWGNYSVRDISFSSLVFTLWGLVVSVIIYSQYTQAWFRFIASLGFFTFLSVLTNTPPLMIYLNEVLVFNGVFIALLWWSFKRATEVHLPLIIAFALWAFKVVVFSLYSHYIFNMFLADPFNTTAHDLFMIFNQPFVFFENLFEDFNINALLYGLLSLIASFVPLWAMLQLLEEKDFKARIIAISMGLLVAWLWFARLDVIIPLSLMILGYHFKNRKLYYLAMVIGLVSLAMLYFNLTTSLTFKAYLLLITGGLFLILYGFAAKMLLGKQGDEAHEEPKTSYVDSTTQLRERMTPSRRINYYGALGVAALLPIAVAQWQIHSYERILSMGQPVLLRLAPVDPRSLMQGDYMRINYEVTRLVQVEYDCLIEEEKWSDATGIAAEPQWQACGPNGDQGHSMIEVSDNLKQRLLSKQGVRFIAALEVENYVAERVLGFYDVAELSDVESSDERIYLPFVVKSINSSHNQVRPRFSTEFFFNQEQARRFEQAEFAEVRINKAKVMLKSLLDSNKQVIESTK